MPTCFVIQPFDKGKFDKRYDDVFKPAIEAAGLDPYRVDRDPAVSIPIDEIESGISSAAICLADITTDNPNVWFELGYAIAARKDVILVCSEERKTKFPFDVQHRTVTKYSTDSSSDFDKLRSTIESRIKATLSRREKLGQVAEIQSTATVEGLDQHQIAVLVSVAEQVEDPDGGISAYVVRSSMESAGFTNIATTLGLKALLLKGMLSSFQDSDYNGNEFTAYRVTDSGMQWLFDNKEKLTLTREGRPNYGPPPSDDIPF
jgi:hypothetical protein